jgi:NAD dependent epimerase/dehydratase family.
VRILLIGALGEVGRSTGDALKDLGHDVVPVSSRQMPQDQRIHSLESAIELVASGAVDLVVHAGGRGDKRAEARDPASTTRTVGRACEQASVRGVLISTVRVLEDARGPVPGSAPVDCHTEYARANAANEREWLAAAPTRGCVLRMANYFCAPSGEASPQTQLLPWSLVTEALSADRVSVRSAPSVSREFVSALDVARALVQILEAPEPPRICSTLPGLSMSLKQLTDCVCDAFERSGRGRPAVTFGTDEATGPALDPDWLASYDWSCTMTDEDVVEAIEMWLSEHHSIAR